MSSWRARSSLTNRPRCAGRRSPSSAALPRWRAGPSRPPAPGSAPPPAPAGSRPCPGRATPSLVRPLLSMLRFTRRWEGGLLASHDAHDPPFRLPSPPGLWRHGPPRESQMSPSLKSILTPSAVRRRGLPHAGHDGPGEHLRRRCHPPHLRRCPPALRQVRSPPPRRASATRCECDLPIPLNLDTPLFSLARSMCT